MDRTEPRSGWRTQAWVAVPWLALVFGIAYAQYPLYYLTQNQYFFHGLAHAGYGLLRGDWLARTADPWPLFSLLVEWTYRLVDPRAFYVYFLLLLGVYAYSMLGILSVQFGVDRSRATLLVTLALLAALHSPLAAAVAEGLLGFNEGRELVVGVASQRILWDMLHPGAFGVFLLLSIYVFLRGRPFLAVVSAAFAASVHPAYVLSAGVLSLSYVVILAGRRQGFGQPLRLAACALVSLLPVIVYMAVAFRPTSPGTWMEAQAVLVRALERHAVPARWLDFTVYIKIALVAAALYLVRRTELFWVMLISFVVAIGLTLVQIASGNDTLALIYPWRLSVYLVPLSTMIVAASLLSPLLRLVERCPPPSQNALAGISVVILVALMGAGALVTARRSNFLTEREVPISTYEFVRKTKAPGQTYLIPVEWRYFRLYTGAPVFVEKRFNPYEDTAVLEWQRRLRIAEAFYAHPESRCQTPGAMPAEVGITHAVVPKTEAAACDWTLEFDGGDYRVFRVAP
ncbi:MAG: DUF6798 domain-containing protein [bacterium]